MSTACEEKIDSESVRLKLSFRNFQKIRKFTCYIENKPRNNTIARAKVLEIKNVSKRALPLLGKERI